MRRAALLVLGASALHAGRSAADDGGWRSIAERPLVGGSAEAMWDVDPPLALMIAFVVVVLAAARWHWSHRNGRFFTVVPGELFRSGAMPPSRLQGKVRRYGIRAVIDLRSARPAVDREREAL